MALIILDSSTCSICGKTLKESDAIIGWKAFLKKDHKFWKYSDAGMHQSCFYKWEQKDEFEKLYKFQPLVDFEDPKLKEYIEINGMSDWLKEIKEYREK